MAESQNSPFMRGEVIEQDAAKGRVRVKFGQEEDVKSFWLSVNSQGSKGSKSLNMPEMGDQVHALVDWNGEDGTVLGTAFSDEDASPTDDPKKVTTKYADGGEDTYDKGAGTRVMKAPNGFKIEAAGMTFEIGAGGMKISGGVINIE